MKCPPQGQAGHPCSCLPTSPSPGLALPCSGPCKCGVTPDKVTIAAWPGCGLPPARLKMAPAGHWAASGGWLRGGQGCGLGRRRSAQLFLVTGPLSPLSFFPSACHCPQLSRPVASLLRALPPAPGAATEIWAPPRVMSRAQNKMQVLDGNTGHWNCYQILGSPMAHWGAAAFWSTSHIGTFPESFSQPGPTGMILASAS